MNTDIDTSNLIEPDVQESNVKREISQLMFDKMNPEMITFLKPGEIDKLSILSALVASENITRQKLRYDNHNILSDVIYNILILRCSVNGFRSEQGVKIISSLIEQQERTQSLNKNISKILRGVQVIQMNNLEKFEVLFGLLLYNISLYYFFQAKMYLVAIIINTVIILLLTYIAINYSESVLDILEEIKKNIKSDNDDKKNKK